MAQRHNEIIETKAATQTGVEHLPELFSRLTDQVVKLLEAKFNLFTVEVREDAAAYMRGGIFLGVGAIIAAVGFSLMNIALAFFVSMLFTFEDPRVNYALGFLVAGIGYLIVGIVVIMIMKNRLAARNPLPEKSLEEIRKDKQWLAKEA